jgi:hypothetical protein
MILIFLALCLGVAIGIGARWLYDATAWDMERALHIAQHKDDQDEIARQRAQIAKWIGRE